MILNNGNLIVILKGGIGLKQTIHALYYSQSKGALSWD
jgi:hypothetical protein